MEDVVVREYVDVEKGLGSIMLQEEEQGYEV